MSTINVNCVDQVLTFTNMPVIASGDINADKIKFTFDSNWSGYSNICVFYQQKGSYYYGLIDNNNEVVIPSGVINQSGIVHFAVSGHKGGVTRTSSELTYSIVEGAYTEVDSEEGQNLVNIMRTEYERIVGNLAYLQLDGDNAFEYNEDTTNQILTALPSCVRMAKGSYTGTGTYGQSNPTSISFPFVPVLVIITQNNSTGLEPLQHDRAGGWKKSGCIWVNGQTLGYIGVSSYFGEDEPTHFSLTNKTLSFYQEEHAYSQLNENEVTYNYIAFGLWGDENGYI